MRDRSNRFTQWAVLGSALTIYCFWAGLQVLQHPGLQYDEALLTLGAVQMRHSAQELALPHDPNTWVCAGHCVPLMTLRYLGALKEFLCLPLFALFRPSAIMVRLPSILLAAIGIWGFAKLAVEQISRPAAAAIAFALALHPAYVGLTVFDNSAVAGYMAAFGLLSAALSNYLRRADARAAFLIGLSMGLGVWIRANFLWLLAAVFVSALLVLGRRLLAMKQHITPLLGGAALGGAPFLIYQIISQGGTWQALSMFRSAAPIRDRLYTRLILGAEVLLSDRERRAMWDGPSLPGWQRWIFPCMVLVGCLICLIPRADAEQRRAWCERISSLALLMLTTILFLSPLEISEHHLIAIVPLAVFVTVLAGCRISARCRWGRVLVAGAGIIYLGSALFWLSAAVRGLHVSGGTGQWSDAVFGLSKQLERDYSGREIKILDWGLQNNLYVLSDGRLKTREIFADATADADSLQRPWSEEVNDGGVFLLNGAGNRQFPEPSLGFERAVAAMHPAVRRLVVNQRNGVPYAEIIEIAPHTGRVPSQIIHPSSEKLATGNPSAQKYLEGFYQIEESGWRWTKRRFVMILPGPGSQKPNAAFLVVHLYIPDTSIERLGPLTLTAQVGNQRLSAETYSHGGQYTFKRSLEPALLASGPNRIAFTLDKSLPPTSSDRRELGIIVVDAALEYQ